MDEFQNFQTKREFKFHSYSKYGPQINVQDDGDLAFPHVTSQHILTKDDENSNCPVMILDGIDITCEFGMSNSIFNQNINFI